MNVLGVIQHEILRQVADHQAAPPVNLADVRVLEPGQNFQKGRLAATVPSHQPDAVALLDAERGLVEDIAVAVANDDVSGGDKVGHI